MQVQWVTFDVGTKDKRILITSLTAMQAGQAVFGMETKDNIFADL